MESTNPKKYLKVENDKEFLSEIVDGYRIWAYIRFNVYMKLEEVLNNQEKRLTKNKYNIKEILLIILNCTLRNPLIRTKPKDVLIFSHARRQLIDNTYHCIYTDDLYEKLGDKAIMGEFVFRTKHFEPVYTNNLLYLDYIDIIPGLLYKIKKHTYKEQLNRIEEFVTDALLILNKEFNVDLDIKYFVALSQKRFIWYVMKKKYIYRLIKKITPKVIVEVVSYETNKMIINEIADQMGIPTFELQHGVISQGHIAYNYYTKYNYSYMPKYLLTFSEYWNNVASFPFDNNSIIPVGYPYLDDMLLKYPPKQTDEYTIIVLSQPEYSIKLMKNVMELIKILDSKNINYKMIYKLHPAEYNIPVSQFSVLSNNPKVHLIHSSKYNLYELFAKSNIQIGVTSTAIFEGVAYGLKALIFHFEKTDEYMRELCQTTAGEMFDSASEMAQRIISLKESKDDELKLRELFFKSKGINNIVKVIFDVIK